MVWEKWSGRLYELSTMKQRPENSQKWSGRLLSGQKWSRKQQDDLKVHVWEAKTSKPEFGISKA